MLLLQFFTPKIAHSSYILAGNDTCAVIDPRRDVQIYLDTAHSMGLTITHILETHLHADFVSGHMDLAERTGATIYAPKIGYCSFDHVAVSEGDEIRIEDMVLQVVETPGHTPEHVSYVVIDESRGAEPIGVFCGDTLFVGDVGRPDLFPGRAEELGHKLHTSLYRKLMNLPDFCEIYPLHAAGSLCGKAIAAKRQSTIGYERRYNSALQMSDVEEFIRAVAEDMPPAPDHFSRCTVINTRGPALVESLPFPRAMTAVEFHNAAQRDQAVVLDVRPYESFAAQHIAGAYAIDLATNFPTFAGWVIPPEKEILLVANSYEQVQEAVTWLRRVGQDDTTGFLDGGMPAWASAGLPTRHVSLLSAGEFHEMLKEDASLRVLDVRSAQEFSRGHLRRAVNIPVAELRTRHVELEPNTPMVVMCPGGNRSTLAVSLLLQRGFSRLMNLAGGLTGYNAAGYSYDL